MFHVLHVFFFKDEFRLICMFVHMYLVLFVVLEHYYLRFSFCKDRSEGGCPNTWLQWTLIHFELHQGEGGDGR